MSGRYESLIARRHRARQRRRHLRALAVLVASFSAGLLATRGIAIAPFAGSSLPDVAATVENEAPSSVRSQGARFPRSEPQASGEFTGPVPPPPAPRVPPELLALLPPTVRAGVASVAPDGADRIVEQVALDPTSSVPGPLEIEYTLDASLTRRLAEILRPIELGHVVVLDPADGRVLGYASTDPEHFPATRAYPTASLMKVVTAAAVLERAPEAAERPCRFVGSPYYLAQNLLDPPARGRSASFVQALATSNNQCFAQLAVHELGSLRVFDAMRRLGLLEAPGAGHDAGEVDPVHDRLELGKLGSGLAGSRISPLAAARLAAVLADGQVVAPRWIARVRDVSGTLLRMPDPPAPRRAFDPSVTAALRSMMVETTERGTARRAFHDRTGNLLLGPVAVAGKTGSLNGQNPDGLYEWFIGLAPADAPRVAIASLVVNRGRRHESASQIGAAVLHALFCDATACRREPALDRRAVAIQSTSG